MCNPYIYVTESSRFFVTYRLVSAAFLELMVELIATRFSLLEGVELLVSC
ncbi:hypothetical protein GJV44_00533 [Candidatus Vallotia cooleyia]|nr:hypothetical protein GJV44_00533 [Candidatus Vallotia cooleyia]